MKWKKGVEDKPSWSVIRGASPAMKAYWQQYDSIILKERILYRVFIQGRDKREILQFLAPKALQQTLLDLAHADAGGHLAARKTEAQLQARTYWYERKSSAMLYCRNCDICEPEVLEVTHHVTEYCTHSRSKHRTKDGVLILLENI